jgi:hypothetical protein
MLALALALGASPAARAHEPAPARPEGGDGETATGQAPPAAGATERDDDIETRIRALEEQLQTLLARLESEKLERLVQEAEAEARAGGVEERPEDRPFLEGGLALQKLNPELTFFADILGRAVLADGFYATESDRSRLSPRAAGLHLQHVLDPFSSFKASFHISPDHHFGVEEVYVNWFGLARGLSLSVGRFRQSFGVLNRWHEHDLDQAEYPSALRFVLGDEGLVGNGVSLRWLMPRLWADANELILEVVDGDNELLFSGKHFSRPSTLLHLKNYFDLSPDTYLELGLTGMLGYNNKRGFLTDDARLADEPWRHTLAAGADLTLSWVPRERAKYRSFTWRSELCLADRQLAPGGPERTRRSWGFYSYVQPQLSARWFCGLRADFALPTERGDSDLAWDIVPYVTFWQSEFVYLRFEYQHGRSIPYLAPDGSLGRRTDNRLLLQIDFAAGPHKHEKY